VQKLECFDSSDEWGRIGVEGFGAEWTTESDNELSMGNSREPFASSDCFLAHRALDGVDVRIRSVKVHDREALAK
jgi:hypothetical protein